MISPQESIDAAIDAQIIKYRSKPFSIDGKGLIGQLHFVGLWNNMIDFIHATNYLQYPIRRLINIP